MLFRWAVTLSLKHWSPVIVISRQPVLMLARPWQKPFFFIHEKENTQSGILNRAERHRLGSRRERARIYRHRQFAVLLTSWWESPPPALRAPRPQTRACWWSCICSTAVLRRSSTWEHKQLLHEGPLLIPQLRAHTNDPESCLTALFYIPRRAEGSPLGERRSVRAKVITVSNPESRMTIIRGFLNSRTVPSLQDKLVCLYLTNLGLAVPSEKISHAVTNGVSVITTHHRCRMGSGVCLIATRAPPWSRYSTAYSSSKICWDKNAWCTLTCLHICTHTVFFHNRHTHTRKSWPCFATLPSK